MSKIEKLFDKHFPCDHYHPDGDFSKPEVHSPDCFACKISGQLLPLEMEIEEEFEAMQEELRLLREFKNEALSYADKFVQKVELGRAISTETYADMQRLLYLAEERKTSLEWFDIVYPNKEVTIIHANGWDGENLDYSFHEELITKEEFVNRVSKSTCSFKDIDDDGIKKEKE